MAGVYYSWILPEQLDEMHCMLSASLPESIVSSGPRFYHLNDTVRHLMGRWLLFTALRLEGESIDKGLIHLDKYNRPFIEGGMDFNISHSGNCVVCAVSRTSRVGIDVEEVVKVNIEDFRSTLTNVDISVLEKSSDLELDFFKIWTKKEAVAKANGKGIALPLDKMDIHQDWVNCEEQDWKVMELNFGNKYVGHIAYNGNENLRIHRVDPLSSEVATKI